MWFSVDKCIEGVVLVLYWIGCPEMEVCPIELVLQLWIGCEGPGCWCIEEVVCCVFCLNDDKGVMHKP